MERKKCGRYFITKISRQISVHAKETGTLRCKIIQNKSVMAVMPYMLSQNALRKVTKHIRHANLHGRLGQSKLN